MQNLSLKESDGDSEAARDACVESEGESAAPSRDNEDAWASGGGGGGGGGGVRAVVRFARRASRGSVDMAAILIICGSGRCRKALRYLMQLNISICAVVG